MVQMSDRATDIRTQDIEESSESGRIALNAQRPVKIQRGDLGGAQHVLEVTMGARDLIELALQLVVDGLKLLVDGLQLLLAGLQVPPS